MAANLIFEPRVLEEHAWVIKHSLRWPRILILVSCPDPFRKIEKGSGNTAIQCLVPKEFNQSLNHMLMFYIGGENWRCVQLHGLHDWIVQQILILSVLHQGGTSLSYEWRQLPQYISKQRLHCCLARDREAGKSDRAMYVLSSVQILSYVGTEQSDRPGFMRKTCFSPFKPYLQLR